MLGSRINLVNLEELEEFRFLIMLRTHLGDSENKLISNSRPPDFTWEAIEGFGDAF